MLNRRLIRIKVFQTLFGEFNQESTHANQVYTTTKSSILGIEQHFLGVLSFLPEFRHFIITEHNPADFKFSRTEEDIKTFNLIKENVFTDKLEKEEHLKKYLERPIIRWADEKDMMFIVYKQIRVHEKFKALKAEEFNENTHLAFAKFIYKFLIMESVEFEQFMEEKNIVWYDEKIPILKSLEKIFESYEQSGDIIYPELSQDLDEDLSFASDLINRYLENAEELESTINSYTPGWDSDRITKIDFVLMCMALCEFKYLPFVPVKVTMNEYIEIAKMYSTPQSSKFINGTLDKILKDWQTAGTINKSGRGLIG